LWVGSDLSAIGALVRHGPGRKDVLVLHGGRDGITLYYSDGEGRLLKGRAELDGETPPLPDLGWNPGAMKYVFGTSAALARLDNHPELEVMEETPADGWTRLLAGDARAGQGFLADPVIMGGALAAARGHPPAASLLADPLCPTGAARLSERWSMRQLALAAGLAVLALAVTLWWMQTSRADAQRRLAERAQQLRGAAAIHRSQEAVLGRIRRDRAPTIPIFEALLEAVPGQVAVQSMSISERGELKIEGAAKNGNAPIEFQRDLEQSGLFENVQLNEVGGENFSLSAHVKGRRRRP
jgi:hypothetical protein